MSERANQEKSFDLILWGATGFTGELVAGRFLESPAFTEGGLRWALAGRSRSKLEAVRAELAARVPAAAELPILLGDSHDAASMRALAAQAKVICSTVGPYAKHGSALVAACVSEGAHYTDITGEVPWVAKMVEAHHEEAAAKGLRIVPFGGFDSIPSDLGALMVQEAMLEAHGRPCEEIRAYFGKQKGAASGGTIATMMNMVEEARRDPATRRALTDPYALNPPGGARPKVPSVGLKVARDEDIGGWIGPFVMAATNTRVVRRSAALMPETYGERFRYTEVASFPRGPKGMLMASAMAAGLGAFMVGLSVAPIRSLLKATVLPKPGEGPDRAAREAGYFHTYHLGVAGPHRIWGHVAADQDPGYGATSIMLREVALCLALDADRLPERYGVLTTASAMGSVLIERLRAAGMTFETSTSRPR